MWRRQTILKPAEIRRLIVLYVFFPAPAQRLLGQCFNGISLITPYISFGFGKGFFCLVEFLRQVAKPTITVVDRTEAGARVFSRERVSVRYDGKECLILIRQ